MKRILLIITILALTVEVSSIASADTMPVYDSTQMVADSGLTAMTEYIDSVGSETQEEGGISKEDITVMFLFVAFWVALLILARSTIRSSHYTLTGRSGNGSRNASWTGEYIGRFDGNGASGRW